jgi:hypothetical protein
MARFPEQTPDAGTLLFVWKCDGETLTLPFVAPDGASMALLTALLEHLPEGALAALWRGVAGERLGMLHELREENRLLRETIAFMTLPNSPIAEVAG